MKAKVGDWLVIKGTTIDQPDQRGLISEVHSPDGSPPYVVRWLETDHVATVFPGADAVVVTAAEQDGRRRAGATSVRGGAVGDPPRQERLAGSGSGDEVCDDGRVAGEDPTPRRDVGALRR